ncbi:MAG TPA: class I SAM-dependent methyltransferase [Longimicrobiaceae bacterium]|nr:class I SAM-dependent methyltransferase [Longimicrobiaceae bacterium]
MSDPFYSDPELYDLVFAPGGYGPFYAGHAKLAGGPVLELACGTGQLLVPVARGGARAVGLDLSAPMLAAARARAAAEALEVRLVEGDMRAFDLDERFALVYVARNSLLHLPTVDDFLACFACVREHLLPGGAFVFDVFNPDVRILARAPGERFPLMRVEHPRRGEVRIEATSDYDAATQVNRATWYFSAADEPDFLVAPLHLRSIFPQELPLLLAAGGLRLESRHGDFAGGAFGGGSRHQVCVCRPA